MQKNYFGVPVPHDSCLCCDCGNTYEQIREKGDYCPTCGEHRHDIAENVFRHGEAPSINGMAPSVIELGDEEGVFVGFKLGGPADQIRLENDYDSQRALLAWVKERAGVDMMLNVMVVKELSDHV